MKVAHYPFGELLERSVFGRVIENSNWFPRPLWPADYCYSLRLRRV